MASRETAKARRSSVPLLLALTAVILAMVSMTAHGQAVIPISETAISGTLSNLHVDKRVVQSGRWFLVREFTIDFAVRDTAVYCGELTTTDATEAHDLIDSNGQAVQFVDKGKDLYLTLKTGRRIRTRKLSAEKCPRG